MELLPENSSFSSFILEIRKTEPKCVQPTNLGDACVYDHLIGGLAECNLRLLLSPDKLSCSCMFLGAVFCFSLSETSLLFPIVAFTMPWGP